MKISKHILVTVVAIVIILAGTIYFALGLKRTPAIAFTAVKAANITQAVTASGQVTAAQDLSLAFEQGGSVAEVDVKVGDAVKAGQTLIRLNTGDVSAAVSQAKAALDLAQANYAKILSGATSASVDVAQTTLDNAQKNLASVTAQQNLIVKNAAATLLNSNLAAIPATSNVAATNPVITGSYIGTDQGQYQIKIYGSGSGYYFTVTGLENGQGQVSTAPVALGTRGLSIQFASNTAYTNDSWNVSIPNTQGANYLTNLNAYNNALQTQNQAVVTAQAAVDSAQSALDLVKTPARPEDIAAANAQVEAASAQLQSAQNNLSKSALTAPIDGVITSVDTKVGQTVAGSTIAPGPDVIKMISSQKFQIIAYLSQDDVGKIKVSDPASVTLDAYGSGTNFDATVIAIDPSATVTNGISTYKTTLEFNQNDDRIKEGMDANLVITDEQHQNVLVIPETAIIKKGSQEFVLTQTPNGKPQQTAVQTGIVGLDGNVEVTSGLSAGQNVAAFGNQ